MKKIFLAGLVLLCFSVQMLSAQELVSATPSATQNTRGYLVGPGDKIEGKVLGEDQFNFTTTIDDDGFFEVPFVDEPILAKCRTEKQLREDVKKHLSKYLRRPLVSVQIVERRKPAPVIVAGEVRSPGQVQLTREARLLELITFSGGENDDAGGIVRVFRNKPPQCADEKTVADWNEESNNGKLVPSRMYSLSSIKEAKIESNPIINPGDIVLVEKASPVYFNGEVNSKTGVYIKEGGLSLMQALAMVGGVREQAQIKNVRIYRKVANSQDREVIVANLKLIKLKEANDIMLEPYDIVDIAKKKKGIGEIMLEIVSGAGRQAASAFATGGSRILY